MTLEFVFFHAGGHPCAVESRWVNAMLGNDGQAPSLASLLGLGEAGGRTRRLVFNTRRGPLTVEVEEPVTLERVAATAIHALPELVRQRHPMVQALIASENGLVTVLNPDTMQPFPGT